MSFKYNHSMLRLTVILLFSLIAAAEDNWTQFRGPNASGVAGNATPPVEFSASKNLLWKQALPSGHSSPVVWGDRIFLTAFDKSAKQLEVICLSRKDGAILWRRPVTASQL